MTKGIVLRVVAVCCLISTAACQSKSESDALAFSKTAPSNLSETSLPSTDPYISKTYLPYCKQLNTDSCGVIVSSLWKWPACCSSRANFSSYDEKTGQDCTYLDVPYSPSGWTCPADSVKACCKNVQCTYYRASSTGSAVKSCPPEKPESTCCSSTLFSVADCEAQRSATTDTCYARKLPYLVCCPKGTEDVLEASSNDITSALLKN